MIRGVFWCGMLAALLSQYVAGRVLAAEKSIFDEDDKWQAMPVKPAPAPVKPVPVPVPAPAPVPTPAVPPPVKPVVVPPVAIPPTVTDTANPPAAKLPIPEKQVRDRVLALARQIFTKEYADATPAGRGKLSVSLHREARAIQRNLAAKYVLLDEARTSACAAGDSSVAKDAVDILCREFEVDRLVLSQQTLEKLLPRVDGSRLLPFYWGLEIAEQLIEKDDLSAASSLCSLLQQPIARCGDTWAVACLKQLRDLATEAAAVRIHEATLKQKPDSPAAKLAVGRYRCLARNDWATGLPLLARGSDSALAMIAQKDLATPPTAEGRFAMAGLWWDQASSLSPSAKSLARKRAVYWYDLALPGLADLEKVLAKKRIEEAKDSGMHARDRRVVDLLSLVDVGRDTIKGKWTQKGESVVSLGDQNAILAIRYQPPREYDLRLIYTRVKGRDGIGQIVPLQGHSCHVTIGANARSAGIDRVRGGDLNDARNTTRVDARPWLAEGQRYSVVVRVREQSLEYEANGVIVCKYTGDLGDLGVPSGWQSAITGGVSLTSWGTVAEFHSAEVVEIGGQGKTLNP